MSPCTAETFASADAYSTIEALPPRFRANAAWMAELSTINAIDQFETTNGVKRFPRVGDEAVLLRRRLFENSSVDAYSDVNVVATAGNFILYVGDWSNYVILDQGGADDVLRPVRPPGRFQRPPHGRVGWYAVWRNGADHLTASAFLVLNLATTA